MDAANLYAVMTILASAMLLPFVQLKECALVQPTVQAMIDGGRGKELFLQTTLAGIFYYLYSEVAFLCLDNVTPVTHASRGHHQATGYHHRVYGRLWHYTHSQRIDTSEDSYFPQDKTIEKGELTLSLC